MKEYLVCEYAMAYGISLRKARRLTEEEKMHVADWYKEKGFVGLPKTNIDLEYIDWQDMRKILGDRKEDGSFQGCNNSVYIITNDEWIALVNLNDAKKLEKEFTTKMKEIKECKNTIEACEKQSKLYTLDEAKKKAREYNNLYNEGGFGHVPHFYTMEEYEHAKRRLSELNEN